MLPLRSASTDLSPGQMLLPIKWCYLALRVNGWWSISWLDAVWDKLCDNDVNHESNVDIHNQSRTLPCNTLPFLIFCVHEITFSCSSREENLPALCIFTDLFSFIVTVHLFFLNFHFSFPTSPFIIFTASCLGDKMSHFIPIDQRLRGE